jgi:hypothetical protein
VAGSTLHLARDVVVCGVVGERNEASITGDGVAKPVASLLVAKVQLVAAERSSCAAQAGCDSCEDSGLLIRNHQPP